MSLVTFLGIYFVREAGIALATVGVAFLCENLLRGLLAPMFGALSDRIGRRPLLVAASLATAAVLPCFLLVRGPLSLFAWSVAMGVASAVKMPVGSALLLDLAPPERRQAVLALNYTGSERRLHARRDARRLRRGAGLWPARRSEHRRLPSCHRALSLRACAGRCRSSPPRRTRASTAASPRFSATVRCSASPASRSCFPSAWGCIAFVSPLYGADRGLGEGFIGLVLGLNSVIVALLAVPVATRMEHAGPFRWLGWAAFLVAAALAAFGAVQHAAAAFVAGTVIFSFGELVFSSALPAAVARLAPPGRRGAYQGAWTLVGSFSMGSALFVSGLLRDSVGWPTAWWTYAAVTAAAGLALLAYRAALKSVSDSRNATRSSSSS